MTIVILTASRMKKTIDGKEYSGKCVTGLDLDSNRVVRLVQNKAGAPMENPFCNYYTPLNVYEMAFKETCPLKCQTENIIADYENPRLLGKYKYGIQDIYNRLAEIQKNDLKFIRDGYDKLSDISMYNHSLEIIKVADFQVKANKCSFTYNHTKYFSISLTDPDYVLPDGQSKYIGDAYIAVSIPTDDYFGSYYKFVASVFPYT